MIIEPSCDASATHTDAPATCDVSQCRRSDVDRDALLALTDEIDRSALELLKTNDLDPNRKRRAMRREHAQDLMAASSRIREALGVSDEPADR